MLALIANNRRRVPVPPRVLRLLAGGASRVRMATILAHLLRCLYLRNRACNPAGTCKASWTAKVFGVDARNVKAARKKLVEIGWLIPNAAAQWRLNRYGAAVSINLAWRQDISRDSNACETIQRADSPPRLPAIVTASPPPVSDKHLPTEYKNQKPPSGRPAGVWKRGREAKPETIPDWKRLCPEDLRSLKRLGVLYREAVARKLIVRTESSRLAFVAGSPQSSEKVRTHFAVPRAAHVRQRLSLLDL